LKAIVQVTLGSAAVLVPMASIATIRKRSSDGL
jgi:hypothetical protein